MSRTKGPLAWSCLLAGLCLAATNTEVTEVGKQPVEASFPSGGSLRLELCPGGVEIRGVDEDIVRLSYRSERDTSNVKVRLKTSGKEATLEVDRCPSNDFRMTLEVPKLSDLRVRMVAGQLEVKGITGNKDVELEFGELVVRVERQEDYAHVDASVTTGQVAGSRFKVDKAGFFRSFEKEGPGKYQLHAHVGAGQVTLD